MYTSIKRRVLSGPASGDGGSSSVSRERQPRDPPCEVQGPQTSLPVHVSLNTATVKTRNRIRSGGSVFSLYPTSTFCHTIFRAADPSNCPSQPFVLSVDLTCFLVPPPPCTRKRLP